ncbi:metallophosphoesterase [Niabella beijingensis]|uniref:metallophosphoesterase n=1 Tax=Niabella beijingensis TaxID=2872700 RepID=UPI001CC1794C|nr:metallophosphoesterase [Niabella beijingensis]MBZ4190092.1 metallophosphoesterase [Niabella beijingensis]
MRNTSFWWVMLVVMLLIDLYIFIAIRSSVFAYSPQKNRTIFAVSYWGITLLAFGTLLLLPYLPAHEAGRLRRSIIFTIIFALFLGKILAAVFFLVDDIRRLAQWVGGKLFSANSEVGEVSGADLETISRSGFLTWLGIAAGGGIFSTLLFGLSNKYNYKIKRVTLSYPNLPAGFKGFRMIQLSDIHSGSFSNRAAVNRGVDMVLKEKADLIVFTGDLVNNTATEMEHYIEVFSRLKAPMGVFSTLGNHDYGDYHSWPGTKEKTANLDRLKSIHAQMGWKLLLDEHLPLERNGDQIGLIGVQNISGKARFHSYGDMARASNGAAYPFKILLSHDPSHWDAEVTTKYTDVDLMLSGHTHGMQFGVEIPGFRWSPVQYVYKQWAGLYEKGKQKLYVNRGFGFIGYPGRVGILPEITVFEFV